MLQVCSYVSCYFVIISVANVILFLKNKHLIDFFFVYFGFFLAI